MSIKIKKIYMGCFCTKTHHLSPTEKKISKKAFLNHPTVQLSISQMGVTPLGEFCDFSEKNSHFNAIWITFRTFLEPFEKTKLLKSEAISEN